jgi:hypothetical protein
MITYILEEDSFFWDFVSKAWTRGATALISTNEGNKTITLPPNTKIPAEVNSYTIVAYI